MIYVYQTSSKWNQTFNGFEVFRIFCTNYGRLEFQQEHVDPTSRVDILGTTKSSFTNMAGICLFFKSVVNMHVLLFHNGETVI